MSKLQLYVQQVNSALEETSQQVLASMPRIMNDAQVCVNRLLFVEQILPMNVIKLKNQVFSFV